MLSPSNAQHGTEAEINMPRLFHFDLAGDKPQREGFPDATNLHRVLDIFCGTGEWMLATAPAYPQTEVVGIERDTQLLDTAHTQARSKGVSNVNFMQMDPLQKIDLPDNSFDLVNLRFLATIVPRNLWPKLLAESLRLARPGGIIRLTETDLPISNSVAFEHFNGLIASSLYTTHRSFSPDGVSFAITPMLSELLAQAGCTDIQQATSVSNFSAGMATHASVTQALAHTYQLIQPFLSKATGVSGANQEEIITAYQQMLSEMQADSFCATAFYLTVWGKKP